MILRQFAVRHGRSVIASSARRAERTYASHVSNNNRPSRPSTEAYVSDTITPDQPSESASILDQSHLPPTRASREVADQLTNLIHEASSIQGEVNAFVAAKGEPEGQNAIEVTSEQPSIDSRKNSQRLDSFYSSRRQQKKLSQLGSNLVNVYEPWQIIRNPPRPDDVTLPMLLANQTHLGHATSLWNPANSSYIFGIREGIHIISLDITLAYLRRAAKVVREIARRGGVVLFVGTRKGQRDIVLNAAKLAEGYHVIDRWVAGTLTNGQQILGKCALKVVNSLDKEIDEFRELLEDSNHPVLKPDLVICLNPLENEVCLHECGLHNVPTIGVIDTDANPAWVTYPIPGNDDSLRSIALIAGTLGRAAEEGQFLRKEAARNGELTYSTAQVSSMLAQIKDLSTIRVQARGDKDKDKDTDK